jgi:hypothetical protein
MPTQITAESLEFFLVLRAEGGRQIRVDVEHSQQNACRAEHRHDEF